MIAYPFRLLQCCLVTDGGGALILVSAERTRDFPAKAGLPPRRRRECRDADGEPNGGFHVLARVPRRRPHGLCRGRHHAQGRRPSDDLRRPPCSLPGASFAHLPIYGLEDLGFVPRGEAGAFIAERNTAPGGKLPLNTNGGGLSYMHSGMYGMYALQESVRQMRGTAPAQIPGAKISVCHGVGGMFAASGTVIMSNEGP
jgi:acetyl-CoA acetyltransferase